ncbi:MAG TPA: patatin-like phospholipase family protein [Mycobacteriales bacterium]|nr:patatin-like phospholipase family protein [Mycobacteriales bacterium]
MLGGGGVLGAAEVGMLRALLEAGVRPDLVLGTSVGAINGVFVAADPTPAAAQRLAALWGDLAGQVFAGSLARQVGTAVRTRTSLHRPAPLRRLLLEHLPVRSFAELPVPFGCVAASIERAAEHWFTDGPLVDAVLASAAVPGLLPPVALRGEHFLDGGLVNSIPMGEAVRRGAATIWVLQVGRVERPLRPPRQPWQVASVAFEIARRHRFAADMAGVPQGVTVHVLPTGAPAPGALDDLRYRDTSRVADRIARAYDATAGYLTTRSGSGA